MNNVFNILNRFVPFIYVVLAAYIIMSVLSLFLPKNSIEYNEGSLVTINYKKYDGFYTNSISGSSSSSIQNKKDIQTLERYELKAVYSTLDNGGWAIVQQKSSNESTILQQFEDLNGYKLVKLFKTYIIFEKDSKEYKLQISSQDDVNYELANSSANGEEKVIVENGSVKIQREYLNSYVKDIKKVWNNISISDIRNNNKIEGFKVNRVNTDSVFGKLGLKRGDIIKAVNGKTLGSYGDAFKIYNGINNIDFLTIEVLRNNEIVELNYEIN